MCTTTQMPLKVIFSIKLEITSCNWASNIQLRVIRSINFWRMPGQFLDYIRTIRYFSFRRDDRCILLFLKCHVNPRAQVNSQQFSYLHDVIFHAFQSDFCSKTFSRTLRKSICSVHCFRDISGHAASSSFSILNIPQVNEPSIIQASQFLIRTVSKTRSHPSQSHGNCSPGVCRNL